MRTADAVVELPQFSKGLDQRLSQTRTVRGPVAIVLFEGWRVGVKHANFVPFNDPVDLLVFVQSDFDAIFKQKYECAMRDIADKGYDMYEQYGGFDEVFQRYYRRVADEFILPETARGS